MVASDARYRHAAALGFSVDLQELKVPAGHLGNAD
jgi:hypothetical protein